MADSLHLVLSFQTEMPGDPPGQPGPPPAPKVVAPKTIKCVRKVRVGANIDTSLETARLIICLCLTTPAHPPPPRDGSGERLLQLLKILYKEKVQKVQ